jgi:hypothetical protein
MPITYTPIASTTLTAAQSTVTFSSISGTYTDLILIVNAKANTGGAIGLQFRFNSDSATNYSFTYLNGNGSSASSGRITSNNQGALADLASSSSSAGTVIANIMNYANTTTFKTVVSRGSDASNVAQALVNLWRATPAAITQIDVYPNSSIQFAAGGTFTLYGIKAA